MEKNTFVVFYDISQNGAIRPVDSVKEAPLLDKNRFPITFSISRLFTDYRSTST